MGGLIHCQNSSCKNYWENTCVPNMNGEMINFDGQGKCFSFQEGINDFYTIEIEESEEVE